MIQGRAQLEELDRADPLREFRRSSSFRPA
jgi:hypothetical protein